MSSHSSEGSAVMSASDHKKFVQGLQSGDLIDYATDASLSHWACVQVAIVDTDQIEVIVNAKGEWVKKSSNRIGLPHSHVSTNKHMRAAAQAEAQARAAQAQQSSSNAATGSANAASILASMAAPEQQSGSNASLPLAQQQLHQSHSRQASAAPQQSAAQAAQGEPAVPAASAAAAAAAVHPSQAAAAPAPAAAAPANPAPAPAAAAAPAASASASVPAISDSEAKKFRSELKTGDLVDFRSERHRDRWFLGEVVKVIQTVWGFGSPDVEVFNYSTNDREVIARDSSRLMPPMTKSAQAAASPAPTPAAAAAHVAHPVQKPPASLPPIQARSANVSQAASHPAQSPVVSNQPVNGQQQPANSPNTPAANGAAPAASPPAAAAAAAAAPLEGVPVSPLGTKDPTLIANHGLTVKTGDVADVLDTESKWRLADILSVEGGHCLVHYCHWSNKWDEWIPRNDLRIQPPRTKTEGYTGPVGKRPAEFAAAAAVAHKPTVAPAPAPAPLLPAPRPSYACLAACSWKRVLSTGLSHKEIQTLNELFAQCCHVQDCYEEVLVGKMAPTPSAHHSSLYSPYGWQSPPPAHAKPTLASVSEQLDKLEASIANLGPTLPSLCQFPLSQCASIAANIRALIMDSEDTARRQLLSEREDLFMAQLNKKFQLVEIASDGSCLFSAVGMGHKIQQHVQKLQEHEQKEAQKAAAADKDEKEQEKEIPDSEDDAKASPPPDPTLVLTLLAETADERLQRGVATKCRNDLSTFFQEQLKLDGEASADGSALPAPADEHATLWKNKIQSEVKEVLQQESAGKYSDATSKAVWDELSKSPSASSEKSDSAKISPLSLADTRAAVEAYLKVMNTEGIYGTSLEVEALSEMLQSPIHIYYRSDAEKAAANAAEKPNSDDIEPEQIIGSQYSGPPICLAYYMGNKHYNLLVQREFIPQPPQKQEPPAAAQPAASASPAVPAASAAASNSSPESQQQQQGEPNAAAAAPAEVVAEPASSPSNAASLIDAAPGAAGPGGVKHVEDHFSAPSASASAASHNASGDFDMVEITPGASSTPLTLSRASSTGNTKDKDVDMKLAVDEHVAPAAASASRPQAAPQSAAQHSSAAAAASKPLSKNSSPQLSGSSTASVAGAAPLQLSQPSVAPYAPFSVHAPAAAAATASPRPATAPTTSSRVTLSIRFPHQVNDVLHNMYSNIPLRTLHSHPMLSKFHASQLQYFIQDGIDWLQIDPVSTAEELKLRDGSHVGIKLA